MGLLSAFPGLRRALSGPDLALDLGTANTRMWSSRRGLVVDEPTLVGLCADTGSVAAVGSRARRLAETGANRTVSPLRAGVIADVDAASAFLEPFFRRAGRLGVGRPRVLACAPTDACDDERAAVVEAATRAGAGSVHIVPEPLAAAIGCGMDVSSAYAQMLVDIGDGVTDIAVISSGQVMISSAIRTACSDLHQAVRETVAAGYGTLIDAGEAERITRAVGVGPVAERGMLDVAGRNASTGRASTIRIAPSEIVEAVHPAVSAIVAAVRDAVFNLPAITSCEVIETGIRLTGGGAKLRGMAELLAEATSLDVTPADDPLHAVINGAKEMLAVSNRTGLWTT